jgi:rRNA maturation RNase YbeY
MISFNVELGGFKLSDIRKRKAWLKELVKDQGFKLGELNYIFLDDEGLHKINLAYLDHDTYTDIITFDNSEDENLIEGDIFVSIERITENANKFEVNFETELSRVMAHGVLHLCGFLDKKSEDVKLMREMEEKYIKKYSEL